MQTKHSLSPVAIRLAALGLTLLGAGTVQAQNSSTVDQAFQTAKQAVNPEVQTKVVSVYGTGTPAAIQKWYIIFYDPGVTTHGRAVLVQGNKIIKTYAANGGVTYSAELTFDPSRITSEGPALNAAQNYAAQHNIPYDSVHALLKQVSLNKPFRWRIELINSGKSKGYVFVNALDDKVASFAPPESNPSTAGSDKSNSSDDGAKGFAHDVQKTFLGIGGDLEEFFTGERTVDR